jgi:hypothetical protein
MSELNKPKPADFFSQMKYYTPRIDEFRVGLEYYEHEGHNFWTLKTFKVGTDLRYIDKTIVNYRIKWLDTEDIISLEFKEEVYLDPKWKPFSRNVGCNLKLYISFPKRVVQIFLCGEGRTCIFSGIIRNKFELKEILSMIMTY